MKKSLTISIIFFVLLFSVSIVYSLPCWRVYEGPYRSYGKLTWHIECIKIDKSRFITYDDAGAGKYWVSPYSPDWNRGFDSLEAAADCACKCN